MHECIDVSIAEIQMEKSYIANVGVSPYTDEYHKSPLPPRPSAFLYLHPYARCMSSVDN